MKEILPRVTKGALLLILATLGASRMFAQGATVTVTGTAGTVGQVAPGAYGVSQDGSPGWMNQAELSDGVLPDPSGGGSGSADLVTWRVKSIIQNREPTELRSQVTQDIYLNHSFDTPMSVTVGMTGSCTSTKTAEVSIAEMIRAGISYQESVTVSKSVTVNVPPRHQGILTLFAKLDHAIWIEEPWVLGLPTVGFDQQGSALKANNNSVTEFATPPL